jgi:hypothetical protein
MGIRRLGRRRVVLVLVLVSPLCVRVAAQASSSLPKPKSQQPQISAPDPGTVSNGVYRNAFFGFTCKIPFGWVDRTKEMGDESNGNSTADGNAPPKSILLLAVFEHPPETTGNSVNSAVIVAAEPSSSYPGLRNPEQYFGPLTTLTKSKGLAVVNEPYEFPVGTMQLVRGDFSKPLRNLTLQQSTLVMMQKGYVVSFTFIAGSEDEVNGLVEGLDFGRKKAPPAPK